MKDLIINDRQITISAAGSRKAMFWPSCCINSTYIYTYGDKPFLDADGMLSLYKDWRNVSEWPEVPGVQQTHTKLASKQGNPIEKTGVVGAFCKVYDVYRAIDTFLPGEYTPCEDGSGRTGNRRFWPVDTGTQPAIKNVWRDLPEEVDAIWAEAFLRWQLGETLYLAGDAKDISEAEQEAHSESNAKEGIIREIVSRRVPMDWEKRSFNERKLYWAAEFGMGICETMERDRICAAEVWSECLGGDIKFMRRSDALEINSILASIPGWKRHGSNFRVGCYGTQKGYICIYNMPNAPVYKYI